MGVGHIGKIEMVAGVVEAEKVNPRVSISFSSCDGTKKKGEVGEGDGNDLVYLDMVLVVLDHSWSRKDIADPDAKEEAELADAAGHDGNFGSPFQKKEKAVGVFLVDFGMNCKLHYH